MFVTRRVISSVVWCALGAAALGACTSTPDSEATTSPTDSGSTATPTGITPPSGTPPVTPPGSTSPTPTPPSSTATPGNPPAVTPPGEPPVTPVPGSVTPPTPNPPVTPVSSSGEGSATEPNTTSGGDSGETEPVAPGEPEIRFIGRFAHSGETAQFAWSGSGIVAAFEGTQVSVQLDDSGSNEFTVVIDGDVQPTLKAQSGSAAYPLATGLSAGRHEVELYRRTEANQGVTTFEGFDFGDGTLAAPPTPKTRRIEIVGDSITCGYGNEGADTSCTFSPETENHYLTYGAIAARTLEAELSTVAWSGKGVMYNYDTDTTNPMPTLYGRTLPDDANSQWDFSVKPDAVVINLGTNDYSTEGDPTTEQFRDAYVALVGQVRAGAPDAFILCTNGNMLYGDDLDAARAGIHAAVDAVIAGGDENIAAWDMDVPNDDPGCDWHPNLNAHQLMADALVAELKKHLPWQ